MKKNIAIITGASSGLGKEFVRQILLKENIDEIWALARNENNLKLLKEEFGEKIKPYPIDLSNYENIKKLDNNLQKENANIKILVNNAGFAKFCSYDDITIEESLNMINLNINSVVAMGLICIPFMQKGGMIINIASQAAFQPLPYQNIYSSTKAFVKNYSQALNIELKEKGITVTAVCPGWIKTNLFERGCIDVKKCPKNFYPIVTPDVVAKKAINDALKGKDISKYGLYVNTCHFLAKILPEKWIMNSWLKMQQIK